MIDLTIPHQVIHGDCLEVLKSLPDGCVDAVVTDPPFGIDYQSGHATDALWLAGRKIRNDDTTATRDAALAMLDGLPALVFGSWRSPRPSATKMVLIWDKGGALGMGDLSLPWKPDHEEIYVIGSGFVGSRDCGSVIRKPPVQSMAKNGRCHPNEKPVELMCDLLRKLPAGCTVLDPFCGSGTTGVACVQTGRRFIGIEIEEKYVKIARRRIADAAPLFVRPRDPDPMLIP